MLRTRAGQVSLWEAVLPEQAVSPAIMNGIAGNVWRQQTRAHAHSAQATGIVRHRFGYPIR
jgi:hypothetical protein